MFVMYKACSLPTIFLNQTFCLVIEGKSHYHEHSFLKINLQFNKMDFLHICRECGINILWNDMILSLK